MLEYISTIKNVIGTAKFTLDEPRIVRFSSKKGACSMHTILPAGKYEIEAVKNALGEILSFPVKIMAFDAVQEVAAVEMRKSLAPILEEMWERRNGEPLPQWIMAFARSARMTLIRQLNAIPPLDKEYPERAKLAILFAIDRFIFEKEYPDGSINNIMDGRDAESDVGLHA